MSTEPASTDPKHSPAPWSPSRFGHIYDANGKLVASIHRNTNELEDANAALICAAPDLLAALSAVMAYAHLLPEEIDQQAEAAIAKATV